jgi:type IV pilus assembly protein PilO
VTVTQRVLAEKRAVIVPLLLFIVANVVLYAVVVFPLSHQVANAEDEARVQHQQLNAARFDLKAAKATVLGKTQADADLQQFYKAVLPGDQAVARRITYTRLVQLATQANVKLEHGNNAVSREKGSTLAKLTTTYMLSGTYADVRKFIYSLETAPEFMVLENVTLTTPGDQSRGLAMNLGIATYFRSENVGQ